MTWLLLHRGNAFTAHQAKTAASWPQGGDEVRFNAGGVSSVPLFLATATHNNGGLDLMLKPGGLRRRAQQIGSDFCGWKIPRRIWVCVS